MASTTLNTFILPTPPFPVRAVEIKGSWDNFSQSYQLKRDQHTDHWRGCHTFENIVCDGTTLDASSSRDGGLKMGGTYWYYYILHTIDGDLEYHNTVEPSTNTCPLLPGQQVNVLDVPVQGDLVAGRNVSSTSLDSMIFTLDPKDKYLPPGVRRASTTSAIQKRKARPDPSSELVHRSASTPLDADVSPRTSTSTRAGQSTLDRQRSLMSVFHRMRQTRSAGSNTKSSIAWPRRLFSRTGQSVKTQPVEDVPEVPKIPQEILNAVAAKSDGGINSSIQRHPTPNQESSSVAQTNIPVESVIVPWPHENTPLGEYHPCSLPLQTAHQNDKTTSCFRDSGASFGSSSSIPVERLSCHESKHAKALDSSCHRLLPCDLEVAPEHEATTHYTHERNTENKSNDQQKPVDATTFQQQRAEEQQQQFEDESYASAYTYPESSSLSYLSIEDFSPGFTSNTTHSGPMSPLHLSQPQTPIRADFGDDLDFASLDIRRGSETSAEFIAFGPPSRAPPPPPASESTTMTPKPSLGGFQGYSLPSDDHASALTLRKLPSATLKSSSGDLSLPRQSGKKNFVQSWNDGSEHLLDELNYLSELII